MSSEKRFEAELDAWFEASKNSGTMPGIRKNKETGTVSLCYGVAKSRFQTAIPGLTVDAVAEYGFAHKSELSSLQWTRLSQSLENHEVTPALIGKTQLAGWVTGNPTHTHTSATTTTDDGSEHKAKMPSAYKAALKAFTLAENAVKSAEEIIAKAAELQNALPELKNARNLAWDNVTAARKAAEEETRKAEEAKAADLAASDEKINAQLAKIAADDAKAAAKQAKNDAKRAALTAELAKRGKVRSEHADSTGQPVMGQTAEPVKSISVTEKMLA